MEFLRKIRASVLFAAVLLILIGALLCCKAFVGALFTTIIYVIAGILIGIGVLELIIYFTASPDKKQKTNMVLGVGEVLVGTFAIVQIDTVLTILSYVLAIFVVIDGVTSLEGSLKLKKSGAKGWIVNLVISCLLIVAGAVLIFFPSELLDAISTVVGVILIVDGIFDIVMIIRLSKLFKKQKQPMYQGAVNENGEVFIPRDNQ